jgi:hypothetical protein
MGDRQKFRLGFLLQINEQKINLPQTAFSNATQMKNDCYFSLPKQATFCGNFQLFWQMEI